MGYWDMIAIIQESVDLDDYFATRIPPCCPNDGTPLQEGFDGIIFCPWDGWRYNYDSYVR